MIDVSLDAKRQCAAMASGGASSEDIYRVIVRLTDELDLGGDVLDFGAGTGLLSLRLSGSGRFRTVSCVDLMPRPAAISESIVWRSGDLNTPAPFSSESFDVVIGAEVIEHLENSRAIGREWYRLLRPGGTLILSTPNNESWRSLSTLVVSGHFAAFRSGSYPAHITALVRKDIERLLLEAGFSVPRFVFTDVGSVPKLATVTWQSLSRGLLTGLRYSDNLVAIARKD
jgi:2-polyprenyl-3-methyl-5-hydroxy-6-metoxy-1,4-benzoquinol methylase